MMNICYNEYLEALFEEWNALSLKNGHGIITKDGLMRKKDTDVNILWAHSPKRVMFLLKDQPYSEGDDIRNWMILPDTDKNAARNRNFSSTFLKRLSYLFYGLMHNVVAWESITKELVVECFNSSPVAFVEAKKQSGTSSVKNLEMVRYIQKYKDFLIKEINILQPNIIVCCGGPQYDFALNMLYDKSQLELIDQNVYCDLVGKKVIIYAPHPSYRRMSHEGYFESVMWHWKKFMEKYPDFPNISP